MIRAKDPAEPMVPGTQSKKHYRILNASNQTLYVQLTTGTLTLRAGKSSDVPESALSFHVRIMAKRGHIGLFEKV